MPLFCIVFLVNRVREDSHGTKRKELREMKKTKQSKFQVKILIILITATLLFTTACGQENNTSEGTKEFTLEVTDDNGNVTSLTIKTDESTVGAALLGEGIIDGDVSDFGLMVLFVNGIRADYIEDGAWWAFYIDGEMAMEGVDTTEIEEGKTYAFIYTPA